MLGFRPLAFGSMSTQGAPKYPVVAPVLSPIVPAEGSYVINLNWSHSDKTDSQGFGYSVYRRVNGGSWDFRGDTSDDFWVENPFSYIEEGFFEFKVVPFNDFGTGPDSNIADVTLVLVPPLDTFGGDVEGVWSVARLMLTAYTGPLIRVRADRSGQPEQDIGVNGFNGLDVAAVLSFAAGDPCYLVKVYDQSGNGHDWVQATTSKQPALSTSGVGGRAALLSDGVNDDMTQGTVTAQSTWWAWDVFKPVTTSNSNREIWALADYPAATNYVLFETLTANLGINYQGGNFTVGDTLGTTDTRCYVLRGSTTAGSAKGAAGNTGSVSANLSRDGAMRICGRGDPSHFINAYKGEWILGNGTLTTEQEAQLFQVASDFWGTPVP